MSLDPLDRDRDDRLTGLLQRGTPAHELRLGETGDASRRVRAVGAIASDGRWRPARHGGDCRWMTDEIITGQHTIISGRRKQLTAYCIG